MTDTICMNKFQHAEYQAKFALLDHARQITDRYACGHDADAATVALIVQALVLAGGSNLLKPQEE